MVQGTKNFDRAELPPEIAEKFASGSPEDRAVAGKLAAQAGYVLSGGQWKQIGPDLRDKVNLRKAEKQPDGKYLVEDVDIFYPNAVKDGFDFSDPESVKEIIQNTRRGIESGGTPPGVAYEHPNKEAKANGIASEAHGVVVNIRESPRGDGWARGDFKIDEDAYTKWKAGKFIGMSAGLNMDAGGKNLRFGHVALLGGEAPALNALPMTEIYSANDASGVVCYSAEPFTPSTPQTQRKMKMDKNKDNVLLASKIAACAGQIAACYAADDLEGVKKHKEELGEMTKSINHDAEGHVGGTEDEMPTEKASPDKQPATAAELTKEKNPGYDAAAEPVAGEESLEDRICKLEEMLMNKDHEAKAAYAAIAAMKEKELTVEFTAEVKGLIAKGHQIDEASTLATFSAIKGTPEAFKAWRASLAKTPKGAPKVSPAKVGPVFSASDAAPRYDAGASVDFTAEAANYTRMTGKAITPAEMEIVHNSTQVRR